MDKKIFINLSYFDLTLGENPVIIIICIVTFFLEPVQDLGVGGFSSMILPRTRKNFAGLLAQVKKF